MRDLEVPESSNDDFLHAIAKGSLTSLPLPILGGVIGELFTLAYPSPLEKRTHKFMKDVQIALQELQAKEPGITIQQLSESEEFMTIFLRTSQIAVRTHQEERLNLLRNILVNFNLNIDFDFKTVFLQYVEDLSISSMVILSFLSQFQEEIRFIDSYERLFHIFIRGTRETKGGLISVDLVDFKFLVNELESRGLVRISRSIADLPDQVIEGSYLTDYNSNEDLPYIKVLSIGNKFLAFVYGENKPDFKK